MNLKSLFIFTIASILLSSCVFSLFPIYTEDTLVYDEKLIGKWQQDSIVIEFTPAELSKSYSFKTPKYDGSITMTETPDSAEHEEEASGNRQDFLAKAGYRLIVNEKEKTYLYKVHLVNIGNEYYLDLYPSGKVGSREVDPYSDNFYPVHTFMKLEFDDKNLKLINFNLEKLNKLFKKNLIRLRHEIVYDELFGQKDDGDVIITAKPEEIQKFIKTYSKDPSVFYDADVYTRI